MRSTLSKVKRVAAVFAVAALVAAYVPIVAEVLAVAIVVAWSAIVVVLLAPLARRLGPHLPVLLGHALRVAHTVGPWLSPRPVLARLHVSRRRGAGRPVHGLSPVSLPPTRWLR